MTSSLKMKLLLKAWFLAPNFEQRLFQQYKEYRQGSQTVQAYVNEFYHLFVRNDLMEMKAQKVARIVARGGATCSYLRSGVYASRLHFDRSH